MRLPVNFSLALGASVLLAGCSLGGSGPLPPPPAAANGPAADYPVVVGAPFTIGDTTHTPDDTMNYDEVGHAIIGDGVIGTVAAAHKTLPLPSYVEVTHLDSGKTALVRVDTRGPMRNDVLIELSPAAAAQIGIASGPGIAVRVRRVNPPEAERAMLRMGEAAPMRMETPGPLLTVLKRKIDQKPPIAAKPAAPAIVKVDPDVSMAESKPALNPVSAPTEPTEPKAANPAPVSKPAPTATTASARPAPAGGQYVQVGAFSTKERAEKAAAGVAANVSKSGKYWVARIGPLKSSAEVKAALAKAKAAGYGDAIVRRIN